MRDPNTVLISRSTAIALYGTENAVGKTFNMKITVRSPSGVFMTISPLTAACMTLTFLSRWPMRKQVGSGISCMGLFGLASFVAEQRTKEIGIRKVLGARVAGLWVLLSAGFLKLVALSMLIAMPLSYYCMDKWLQNYTLRTSLSAWIFVVTGVGMLLVTLATVSFQAVRAALMNPVKSLRNE